MGQGLETFLGDPGEAETLEECVESEFVRTLVCQAGLVMAGEKPAAVFGFTPRAWKGEGLLSSKRLLCDRLLSEYTPRLAAYGVRLACLARKAGGLMLLAWRPALIEGLLADAENRAFLAGRGLPCSGAAALASGLVARLRGYYEGRSGFPHEVGLVLGYPVADVAAFMADGAAVPWPWGAGGATRTSTPRAGASTS